LDSGFEKIQRHNCTLFVNRHFRNDNLEQAFSTGEKTLQEHYQLTPVFSSDSSRVYKFSAGFDGMERWIYFKRYLQRSALDFIKHLVRPSRAKRSFKATLMLEKNGFEAPVVVAMGECKFSFFEREDFLATIEVEDAKQIYQFMPESAEDLTKEQLRDKRELIRAFGQTVGRMHARGIFHGDLKVVNVLARQEKKGWVFSFIDNERTKKFYRLPAWLRLKNLVQLNMYRTDALTDTDRMRFFKSYLQENPLVARKRNKWVKKIITKTNRRLEKRTRYSD
jgi:tRNA A-37 threonylcarbamoyl transferase component Bud32